VLVYKIASRDIKSNIYIPKYYDPDLNAEIHSLSKTHDLLYLGDLIDRNIVHVQTGHEIGKMAYGTGNIPFVRTSDISNWEIKTIPKQGISEEIYKQYADKEDVQVGDILLVRDGTYLIGTNCIVTQLDLPMVFQSHILKIRVLKKSIIDPFLLFLSFNCSLVQRQIRNMQFTADIIDTLGSRYRELVIPIPRDNEVRTMLHSEIVTAVERRIKLKAAIKQMPLLIEQVLEKDSISPIDEYLQKPVEEILEEMVQDTTTLEAGAFSTFMINSNEIKNQIFLPKYYDPSIRNTLAKLSANCDICAIQDLVDNGALELSTGDEIGKMAYGTGEIPFVRTSDFSNWEIKTDVKQGVSEDIYQQYAERENVEAKDILLVRDGTYLIGTSCMITDADTKMLFCGGLIKIRATAAAIFDPYLLLALLNSYIVKRQIRTKQFTRDVIDTLGQRLKEVYLPIPKNETLRKDISDHMKEIVEDRIVARDRFQTLSEKIISIM
jgi:restriction endonuclease S subunit